MSFTAPKLPALVAAFRDATLPRSAWTHEAHLRVGMWHVVTFGAEEALRELRDRIRALNDAHGTPNTDRQGYHETITWAYVRLLSDLLVGESPGTEVAVLAERAVERLGDRGVLYRHYSPVTLHGADARRRVVPPDLEPLP